MLLLLSTGAGDAPSAVSTRLASFVHDACFYMAAHPPPPRDFSSLAPEPRLASHFGRIVKSSARDDTGLRRYTLAVPQFPGWTVTFLGRQILIHVPVDEQPLLGDLAQLLGEPTPSKPGCRDITSANFDGPPRPITAMDFPTPNGWPADCALAVGLATRSADGKSEQRVTQMYVSSAR